ncbi:MAG: hypothetical protein RRY14_01255 [Hydrogenoanaerobacterium sp.]
MTIEHHAIMFALLAKYADKECAQAEKKYNLEKYGSYYCDFVDINLVKGFNPQNDLQIDQVLSKNAPYCIFHWLGYNATPENEAVFAATKKAIGSSCIRDFNYHTAHLYFTMSRVLRNILPKQGDKIVEAALEEFTSKFGEAATATTNSLSKLLL